MRTVLLDTQIALWIFHQTGLWEIQIKYSLGKLPLPAPPQEYLPAAIEQAGFLESSIENEGIYFLDKLPNHQNDSFDRLLSAHAMLHAWEVATVDTQWEAYPIRVFKG